MLLNYLKSTLRNIFKNGLFSIINIVGFAVSLSVCIVIISALTEFMSYDSFHKDKHRIYRVISNFQLDNYPPVRMATSPAYAADAIRSGFTNVEHLTLLRSGFGGVAAFGNQEVGFSGLWADQDFFDVFSFDLIEGNAADALSQPNSIVLTEHGAEKLFGRSNALNELIQVNDETFRVTGILRNIPKNSHIQFEALGSWVTYKNQNVDNPFVMSWGNASSHYIYAKLSVQGNSTSFDDQLLRLSQSENQQLEGQKILLEAQSLGSIAPGENLSNQLGPVMPREILWALIIFALIVVMSASFNYSNLSMAKSINRTKEVGIRKVLGASRKQVFGLFLLEVIVISLLSLLVSLLLFQVLKPQILALDPEVENIVALNINARIILYFVLFSIGIGTLAGLFPALYLSRLGINNALAQGRSFRPMSHVNVRKLLIWLQFTFSLIFIVFTTVAYKQYSFMTSIPLGFETENVINIDLQGNDFDVVYNEFSRLPYVKEITGSLAVMSTGTRYSTYVSYDNPLDSSMVYYNEVSSGFIPLLNIRLLAGESFSDSEKTLNDQSVLVNEYFLKAFGMGTPGEALGKNISVGGKTKTITGVMENFYYSGVDDGIQSFMLQHNEERLENITLKVSGADLGQIMSQVELTWAGIDPTRTFRGDIYEQAILKTHSFMTIMIKGIGFIGFLTLMVASLGLLGMSVYTAQMRQKEVSIRKVLGATEKSLILLLSKGFIRILGMAALVALPIAYLVMDAFLRESAVRVSIGFFDLFLGVFILVIIGLLTIGNQTRKAARSDSANVLRNE